LEHAVLQRLEKGDAVMTRTAKLALLTGSVSPLPLLAPRPITAMQLAHGGYSEARKAFLCADIFMGRRTLTEHTVAGLARYVGLKDVQVHAALARMDQRSAIEAKIVPLVPPSPSRALRAETSVRQLTTIRLQAPALRPNPATPAA
jgi:hypothetical protein